jgi:hypothetical protein
MKRLPPAKRNQMIAVVTITLGLIIAVYMLLIRPQQKRNADMAVTIKNESSRLQQYETLIQQKDASTRQLADLADQLTHAESDVASGDLYAWTVDKIRAFKTPYHHVDIPTIGQPTSSDCDLIGDFPYKQIRCTLSGTAYYHDLGKFLSDFENQFTHCRVANLQASPGGDSQSGSTEKLNFRMDIIALVKPNN